MSWDFGHSARERAGLAGLLAMFALMLCLAGVRPAFASYADVTDSYPASQDVTVSGSELTASQIPSGAYSITASTSSYMCKISDCTLTVADGAMSATFTISKAYTRLYLGTAEEAAAKTNADGTDDSAYYAGTPADGYVYHVYTLPVSALNREIALATYAGGTKTQKWFTRTVVFNSSAEVESAVKTGVAPAATSTSESTEDSADDSSASSSDEGSNASSGTRKKNAAEESAAKESAAKETSASNATSSATGAAKSDSGSMAGSVAGGGSSGTGPESSRDSRGESAEKGLASGSGSSGKAYQVTPVSVGAATAGEVVFDDDDAGQDAEGNSSYYALLGGLAVGIIVLLAVLARAWLRIAKMRRNLR